ncbi:MAG: hypothetical protein P4L81_03855 [Candidatus Pacebacteria bacterium]|nr:hypothetical protein [Candidatus Paceibacterota bacterium]
MAYDSRVYRILIASPSDVDEEREIAVSVIQSWNDLNSYSRRIALLPLRWETHAAPDYGTRPQEVINRAIVDECDLLVGIFWTRIGSPSGVADSGTIEEIDRVGKAKKPIMLYFSRVEIDPERIDTEQIQQLKLFKEKMYPGGLIENFKNRNEFRDRFTRQLEMKIRELDEHNSSGEAKLVMRLLSPSSGKAITGTLDRSIIRKSIKDLIEVKESDRDLIERSCARTTRSMSLIPIALTIENLTSTGVRNIYIEVNFKSSSNLTEFDEPSASGAFTSILTFNHLFKTRDRIEAVSENFEQAISRFESDSLKRVSEGWAIYLEWDAIQPQRTRLIKPIIHAVCPESAKIEISAKVYSESFSEALILTAEVEVKVENISVELGELLPDWRKIIAEEKESLSHLTKSLRLYRNNTDQ